MTPNLKIGETSLQTVASVWMADAADMRWFEDGFDWTPGGHRVRVRAHADESASRWRLSIETDILKNVANGDPKFIGLAGAQAGFLTSTFSLVYPPAELTAESGEKEAKLTFFSSAYVTLELLDWLPAFLAWEALIQVLNAESMAGFMAETLGGAPDIVPTASNRMPDKIFGVVNSHYVTCGRKISGWHNTTEFADFTEKFGRSDECFSMSDSAGMTLETPFGEDSALIQFISDQQHPHLGSGLLVATQLRIEDAVDQIAELSASLNFLEARHWMDFPQLGCWSPRAISGAEGTARLAHASFVPNLLYSPGVATNFAIWSIGRARWARQVLRPDVTDKPMIEILKKRIS